MENAHNGENSWDNGIYGTGPTKPPANHSAAVTVLLILVIFLTGIVSVLGYLNVRMSRQLNAGEKETDISIFFETNPTEETILTGSADGAAAADMREMPSESAPEVTESEAAELPADERRLPAEEETAAAETGRTERPASGGEVLTLQEIYARCIPSVASISCSISGGSASGTGVVFSEEGYIVTNNHVVEDAHEIVVQLTDERVLSAELVGTDAVSDLAVLRIDADGLEPAEFGNSDTLQVGDTVVAIGDPLGVEYRGTMTDGIISAINRDVTVNGRTMSLIQTNAALNSGNSGGPLINSYGQVIGINTMKIGAFTDDAGVEGIGFAIPSSYVLEIVSQLIDQGYVSGRPSLGLTGETLNSFYQRYYRMPSGLYITEVASGSNAASVGIAAGDMLISLDDTPITSMEDLNAFLYSHAVGDTVTAVIYRSGREYSCSLPLEEDRGA